ncbi:MAG: hypothetical protein DME25_05965 [Verrucomicrobia bacterium]|nr:MAG: hypothetical protein DME25_05965 [Verrucomicrobiota bacterium]
MAGTLDAASQMLGRTSSISGQVIKGDGLGRQMGFPTANIDVTGLALPPKGVYAVQAEARGQRSEGGTHRGVLNIGYRPTLQYGRELEVTFVEKLREERKFASVAELREQIARDVREAQSRL